MRAIGQIIASQGSLTRPNVGACKQIATFLITIFAVGCGPQFNYTGTWNGKQEVNSKLRADPDIVSSYARVTIKIASNGHFDLHANLYDFSGEVAHEGAKVVLKPDMVLQMPIERLPVEQRLSGELTPNVDGTVTLKLSSGGSVLLKRGTS